MMIIVFQFSIILNFNTLFDLEDYLIKKLSSSLHYSELTLLFIKIAICVVLLPGDAHMSNTLRLFSFTSSACPVTTDGKFCNIPYLLGNINEGIPVIGSVISTAIPLKYNIINL